LSSADPTTRRRWIATPAAIIRGARGEHLGPPQPHRRAPARESRHLAPHAGEPAPTGRNQIFRGATRDGSSPQQSSTNADTVQHAGEPPLHLGCETGSDTSTRSAEVANHHKPPPTCTGHSIRQPKPSPTLSPGKVGPQHRHP
jgi:hypothetical protein